MLFYIATQRFPNKREIRRALALHPKLAAATVGEQAERACGGGVGRGREGRGPRGTAGPLTLFKSAGAAQLTQIDFSDKTPVFKEAVGFN